MIKILIVDDEKPICDLVDLNLSAAGYFCKSVQDGMKAIECIEREKFDLILLDIMLPGVTFCHQTVPIYLFRKRKQEAQHSVITEQHSCITDQHKWHVF